MSTGAVGGPGYETSVFINCPFDEPYQPLFRALVFTVEYCRFAARCALEVDDSGETRAAKIIRLIENSRFGIHDISRTEFSVMDGEQLPRFNMPYEFGIFTGFKTGGSVKQRRKAILVLDRQKYRYQKFLSDIAGQDIRSHNNDPETLIREVRGWLQAQAGKRNLYGADYIISQFRRFTVLIPDLLAVMKKTEADLTNYRDLHNLVGDWIAANIEDKLPAHQ
ncbi:MAG: hypothetical protein JWO38_1201 [Gemmataceae bacterium]|nr:hypothetical protein [Gemmataceae bacterium]